VGGLTPSSDLPKSVHGRCATAALLIPTQNCYIKFAELFLKLHI